MINKETLEMRQEWAQSRMKDLTKFIKDNGWNENAMIKARLLAEDLNMINNLEHLLKCDSQM